MVLEMERGIFFQCQFCPRKFSRRYNLNNHINLLHSDILTVEKCFICGYLFSTCDELQNHIKNQHHSSSKFVILKSAFSKNFVSYRYSYENNIIDLMKAQNIVKNKILRTLIYECSLKTICKAGLIITCQMVMLDHVGDRISSAFIPFRAKNFLCNASLPRNIEKQINRSFLEQRRRLDDFVNTGSNWIFDRAVTFDIEVAPMRFSASL